jgi:hypothetical protein
MMLMSPVLATPASAGLARISAAGSLSWHGGPVVHSSAPYLVFWTPPGESIPASSQSLLERYLTDVAVDSGKSSNVFGVDRQYYDQTVFADYRQTFNPSRQVIVDGQPYHCARNDPMSSRRGRVPDVYQRRTDSVRASAPDHRR